MKGLNEMWFVLCFLVFLSLLIPAEVFAQGETVRVSVNSTGVEANGVSYEPATSSNGRYTAFESLADNLVAGDTNGEEDIFVHDKESGQTKRVSVDSYGAQGYGESETPSISANGRYVAFESSSNNLVPDDTNKNRDIFVHDMENGQTERVSINSLGEQANNGCFHASISSDGRYVAFWSISDNLVSGDTNQLADIFVHDRQTHETERVSVNSLGEQANSNCLEPCISHNGQYVAFMSYATNLVPGDTNYSDDIFVHDRLTHETVRASVDSYGVEGDDDSNHPSMASDGRVAFHSRSTNLVSGDTNGYKDVFVHNIATGETLRVNVDSSGAQAEHGESTTPSISADGRYVAFYAMASNLVPGDTNNKADIFVHDLETGKTRRVSIDSLGVEGNDHCLYYPGISPDGKSVAFASEANNLVPGDTSVYWDIFVQTRLSFLADTYRLDRDGGTVNFDLDAGMAHGNRDYLILGSVTGIEPGTPLPGGMATLPLNWDVFTDFVFQLINTPVFLNFYATLNSGGRATAQLNSPALSYTFVGVKMYYAYALSNPWNFASNPLVVEITNW